MRINRRLLLPMFVILSLGTAGTLTGQVMPEPALADDKLLPQAAQEYKLEGPTLFKVNRRSRDLVAEDLNGDGLIDIAAVSNERGLLEIYLQRTEVAEGEPQFERTQVTLDRIIRSTIPYDVNGDGRMDLLMAGSPAKLVVMYQDSNGRLQTPKATELEADRLAMGDLTGNGRQDVLVYHERKFHILRGSTTGLELETWQTFHTTGEPASAPMIIDFDGDGLPDIVYHDSQSFQDLLVRLQSPEGTFPAEFRVSSGVLRAVAPLPAPKGQKASVAAVQNVTRQLVQLGLAELNREDIESQIVPVSEMHTIAFGPGTRPRRSVPLIADFDGDGRRDLVIASPDLSALRLLRQTRSGSLEESTVPSLQGIESISALPTSGGEATPLVFFAPEEKAIGFTRYNAETETLPFPRVLPIAGEPLGVTVVNEGLVALMRVEEEIRLLGYDLDESGSVGDARTLMENAPEVFKGLTVKGLEAMDVNRDGRQDLVVYIDFKPAKILLQTEEGNFEELTATSGVLEGLLSGARQGSIQGVSLGNEGTSVMALKEKFARVFHIDEELNIRIGHQFNGRNANARLVDATTGNIRQRGQQDVILLDRANRCLTVYGREDEGDYQLLTNIQLDETPYSSVRAFDLNGDGREDLILSADDRLGVIYSHPLHGGLEVIASAATTVDEGGYGEVYTLDLLPGGSRELVAIEMRNNLMEIFLPGQNEQKIPALLRFYQFGMFDSDATLARHPSLETQPEPREAIAADLNEDGWNEIITLMHDNIVIYKPEMPETASEERRRRR